MTVPSITEIAFVPGCAERLTQEIEAKIKSVAPADTRISVKKLSPQGLSFDRKVIVGGTAITIASVILFAHDENIYRRMLYGYVGMMGIGAVGRSAKTLYESAAALRERYAVIVLGQEDKNAALAACSASYQLGGQKFQAYFV